MSVTVEQHLERCRNLVYDYDFTYVDEWKQQHPDGKVVGCFPVYTPREIIHASGMFPVGIYGGGIDVEIDRADARVQSFICAISRSTLELGMSDYLKNFDAMYFTSVCDVARNLSGMWERNFPNVLVEYLHYPQNMTSPSSVTYYRSELLHLCNNLEQIGGQKVTPERLKESIRLYNENRELHRQLIAFKRDDPGKITSAEVYVLQRAGSCMIVDEHSALLREVLAELPQRKATERDRIRVVLEGSFCEQPPLELIEVIEEAGCEIVSDDFALGLVWFTKETPIDDDPLRSLAESYLFHSDYSSVRHYGTKRRDFSLAEKVRNVHADGVIFCIAKFCEPALIDYVTHKHTLENQGIPHVSFEFEEKMGVFENVRVQVETFAESILLFD
jgi:benzoyl-CoA reductase subunit C